jgi:hypothetical protein
VKLASKLVGWHIEVRAEGQVEDALKRAEGLFTKKPEEMPAEVPPPEGEPSVPQPEGEPSEASPSEGTVVEAKEGEDVDASVGLPSEAPSAEDAVVEAKEGEPAKE